MTDEITTACGQGDYVVQPGDGPGSIAAAHGHFWQTLWDLPENAALPDLRKHPHVLLPGARIGAFHLSDAELVASARFSPGNGFAPRAERPLRLRYDGWATLDWSCSVRDAESGVAMSVAYVQASLVRPPELDHDSPEDPDEGGNRRALGLS